MCCQPRGRKSDLWSRERARSPRQALRTSCSIVTAGVQPADIPRGPKLHLQRNVCPIRSGRWASPKGPRPLPPAHALSTDRTCSYKALCKHGVNCTSHAVPLPLTSKRERCWGGSSRSRSTLSSMRSPGSLSSRKREGKRRLRGVQRFDRRVAGQEPAAVFTGPRSHGHGPRVRLQSREGLRSFDTRTEGN